MTKEIVLTSATGALGSTRHPVGGGVAVLEALLPLLAQRHPGRVTLVTPAGAERRFPGVRHVELAVPSLADAPPERLLHLGESDYARFAVEFEQALGGFCSALDPARTLVIANDVARGRPSPSSRGAASRSSSCTTWSWPTSSRGATWGCPSRTGWRRRPPRASGAWGGAPGSRGWRPA